MTPAIADDTWRDVPVPGKRFSWGELHDEFIEYATSATIPSKEVGMVRLVLMNSQAYAIEETFKGLAADIHDFVYLKGRQLGISTVFWLLDLFWNTKFSGLQAMYIADDEANKEIHRDIITEMYKSLPAKFSRGNFRTNNRLQMVWHDSTRWKSSRIQWAFANKKNEGQLGRSRGVNFVHGTEMDSWTDPEGVAALTASLAHEHPYRLYLWEGTGQGFGQLYEMWDQAEHAVTTRRIFIGWWRREDYRIPRDSRALWTVYGAPKPSPDELEWGREVKRLYGVEVSREQLCWWRWKKSEGKGINGDESTMMQEYPWLPKQAFQAGGSQFLSPTTLMRLDRAVERAPAPTGYRYDWGQTFDEKGDDVLTEVDPKDAQLVVWEEPEDGRAYLVSADPSYGSSVDADRQAITVWRCHPDQLIQVAQFLDPILPMYQFAWVIAHLSGNYQRYDIIEMNGPGRAVLQELDRMANYAYGLTQRHGNLQNIIGAVQHYLWRRVDTLNGGYSRQWQTGPLTKLPMMEKLRDTVERGALVPRSEALVTELRALRRTDGDNIKAGGVAHDDLAITAAMAVECWTETVIPEIEEFVAPAAGRREPEEAVQRTVRNFLSRMGAAPVPVAPVPYGVRTRGPGR